MNHPWPASASWGLRHVSNLFRFPGMINPLSTSSVDFTTVLLNERHLPIALVAPRQLQEVALSQYANPEAIRILSFAAGLLTNDNEVCLPADRG